MRDTMRAALQRLLSNNEGQTVVEYGLLISLVVLVVVTMLTAAHGQLGAIVSTVATAAPR
jgi:Flp pilus assembly pilin Flp